MKPRNTCNSGSKPVATSAPLEDHSLRPDVVAERHDAYERLRAAISALPTRERQVAELLDDRGLSQREASIEPGLTESRISQIHSRLRCALRLALSGQHEALEIAV